MAPRHHVQRAVFRRDVADHQQGRDDVVIAVRREQKILMPFHLRRGKRQLGVDFAVMKTGAATADQLGGDGRHTRLQGGMFEGDGNLRRRTDPAQRGVIGAVIPFKVETRATVERLAPHLGVAAALFDPTVKILLQGGDFVRR